MNTTIKTTQTFWITVIAFSLFLHPAWAQEKVSPNTVSEGLEYPNKEVGNEGSEDMEGGDFQTLVGKSTFSGTTFSGYGGPEVLASSFVDKWGVLVGGRGGLLINRMFTIGLVGMGFTSTPERGYTDSIGNAQTAVYKMGYGGVYFEYIWELSRAIHFSIPVDLVAIGTSIMKKDGSEKSRLDNQALFGVIPRVNIEFNVTTFFIIAVTGGFRFAFGSDNHYMDPYDAWAPEAGLMFKFGYFSDKPKKKKRK